MSRLTRFLPAALLAAAPLLLAAAAPSAPQDNRWIPMPDSASDIAPDIDRVFYLILWITGIVFVLVEGLLIYAVIKFRHKEGRKVWFSHGNNTLEIIWTIIPALILIFIGVKSQFLWAHIRMGVNGEPKIEVVGQQFQWMVRYAGADGKLGRSEARFVADERFLDPPDPKKRDKAVSLNSFGLDPDDAHGRDDRLMVGTLLLRMRDAGTDNGYVRIRIRSKDVLHSFFVPVFRFKQDAVPGMPVDVWVRPTESNFHVGTCKEQDPQYPNDPSKQIEKPCVVIDRSWQIACAELCGNSHTNMKGTVLVAKDDSDYEFAMNSDDSLYKAQALWETSPPTVPSPDFFKNATLPEDETAPAAPAAPVPVFTPGGAGGSLSGEIAFQGAAPAPRKIAMSGDPNCANPTQTGEELVVNGGKLANVFVYLDEGVAGKAVPAAPATPVAFDQHGCWYKPHVFGIRVGQKLEIRNSDATMHNIHGMGEGDLGFNEAMAKGAPPIVKTFSAPAHGVKVKCDVHGWMGAWAHVMEHPWFAVSGADGKFTIKDVPPGEYTLHAWHETLGSQTVKVTVGASAGGNAVFTFAKN